MSVSRISEERESEPRRQKTTTLAGGPTWGGCLERRRIPTMPADKEQHLADHVVDERESYKRRTRGRATPLDDNNPGRQTMPADEHNNPADYVADKRESYKRGTRTTPPD